VGVLAFFMTHLLKVYYASCTVLYICLSLLTSAEHYIQKLICNLQGPIFQLRQVTRGTW